MPSAGLSKRLSLRLTDTTRKCEKSQVLEKEIERGVGVGEEVEREEEMVVVVVVVLVTTRR